MPAANEITLVDYGSGNIHSISKALARQGAEVSISDDPARVEQASKLVLPGVGHFGDAMRELGKRSLIEPIRRYVASGRPFLGVCVGLQLLMERSEEAPGVEGLGLVPGEVVRFEEAPGRKIPHMGWNQVTVRRRCPVLSVRPGENGGPALLEGEPWFYFVHSYYVAPADPGVVAASANYDGVEFCAVLRHENVQATQFHPEKSQKAGLALLRNFVESPL